MAFLLALEQRGLLAIVVVGPSAAVQQESERNGRIGRGFSRGCLNHMHNHRLINGPRRVAARGPTVRGGHLREPFLGLFRGRCGRCY